MFVSLTPYSKWYLKYLTKVSSTTFYVSKTFEIIVLKIGVCLLTPDELIICQLCYTNDLMLVYMFKI